MIAREHLDRSYLSMRIVYCTAEKELSSVGVSEETLIGLLWRQKKSYLRTGLCYQEGLKCVPIPY